MSATKQNNLRITFRHTSSTTKTTTTVELLTSK